jgi:predicted nucleotide-binding protein
MKDEFTAGKTLPEKFEELASRVDKAIAVATPDDLGELVGCDQSKFWLRARQNVWLEVGWFWGRLGRNNLMVLSHDGIEFPSDLTGIEFYTYRQNPTEQSEKIRSFLGLHHKKAR